LTMNCLLLLVVLIVCCSSLLVSCQFPIPRRTDGFHLLGTGGPDAPIVVDGFFDVLCPDCQRAWPVAKQLIATYSTQIHFRFHTFPLPYHTWAFVANQGVHVMDSATKHNETAVISFIQLMFDQQALFYNGPARNLSQDQIVQKLAAVTDHSGLLPSADFMRGMQDGTISNQAVYAWKYGCTKGTVLATPTYLVNGVFLTNDPGFTLKQWNAVLDPLLRERKEANAGRASSAE